MVKIWEVGKKKRSKVTPDALKQVLARSGGTCERCGTSLHGLRYHIHHKDMDPYNNELSNLLMLCPNCYSRIEGAHPEEILSLYQYN